MPLKMQAALRALLFLTQLLTLEFHTGHFSLFCSKTLHSYVLQNKKDKCKSHITTETNMQPVYVLSGHFS